MIFKSKRGERISPKHKFQAVMQILRNEATEQICQELDITPDQLQKWQKLFVSSGKKALAYTCEADEMPRKLEAISFTAQKAFPTRLLHECQSAICFFCAQFFGKNDIIHIYNSGIPNVTLVDLDEMKFARMKELYPKNWKFLCADAFDAAKRLACDGHLFDLVCCDPYTSTAPEVAFDKFKYFQAISQKYVMCLYTKEMFDALGIDPEPKSLANALHEKHGINIKVKSIITRSSHVGGVYWCVFDISR